MPEQATPVAAPEAPAPAEPAAKPETLIEQWKRVEAEQAPAEASGTGGGEPEPSKADAAEPEKPKEKAKKKVVEPEPTPPNELEALRQNATRLGFVIEDGRVTTAERHAFRVRQREAAEQRAELEKELTAKLEGRLTEYKPKLERADSLTAAIEASDHDGIAKALNFESWDKLVEDQIARKADPNYQRLRALEERDKERARQDEERAVAEQKRQEQQAEQQARASYMQNLSTQMKASKDPIVAALHDEPGFLQAIFAIQSSGYRETGELIAPERAARMKPPGGTVTPHEYLEALFKRLKPVFEPPAAAAEEAAAPAPKVAPRTTTVPKPKPSSTSPIQNKKDWIKDAERRMRDAFTADEKLQQKRA